MMDSGSESLAKRERERARPRARAERVWGGRLQLSLFFSVSLRRHFPTTITGTIETLPPLAPCLSVGGHDFLPLLESLLPWKNRMSWEKEAFCSVFECCDAFFWERKRGAQRAPWITWTDARDRPSSSSATTVNVKFYTISNFIWFDLWSSLWAIDDGHPVMRSYCEVRAKNDITC